MISSCNPSHKYNNRHFTAIESRSPWYLTYNTPLSSLNLGPPRAFTRVQCDICVKRLPGYHATSALTITFLCITHSQNIKYAIKHRFQGWPRGNARVGGKTIRIHKQTIWKYYVVDVSKWWRNYEGKFIYAIYPRFYHGTSWLWGYDLAEWHGALYARELQLCAKEDGHAQEEEGSAEASLLSQLG